MVVRSLIRKIQPPSIFFFSSRRRHTRSLCDWSSDVVLFRSNNQTRHLICHLASLIVGLSYIRLEVVCKFRVEIPQYVDASFRLLECRLPLLISRSGRGDRERSEERRVGKECRARESWKQ